MINRGSRVLLSALVLLSCSGCRLPPRGETAFTTIELLERASVPLQVGDRDYTYRSGTLRDMDGDGVADALLTISSYPLNLPHPIVVLNGGGTVADVAPVVFPAGIPSVGHANQVFFADVDGDGREDLLVSDAGLDYPPWVTAVTLIRIALNRDVGVYEDVSALMPPAVRGLRAYALGAGDFYGDGTLRVFHPAQSSPYSPMLLSWNGAGFTLAESWFDPGFWYGNKLIKCSYLSGRDLDGDGYGDLYLSGTFETPTHRVIFGGPGFPSGGQLVTLPEAPCGHTPWEEFSQADVSVARGGDANQVVFEDFDGDGDLDIAAFIEEAVYYKPGVFDDTGIGEWTESIVTEGGAVYYNGWFQVLVNTGDRRFVDVSGRLEEQDLGLRYYVALLPIDVDLDGDRDIVGHYWSKQYGPEPTPRWGSTVFLNAGNATFERIDASELFSALASSAIDVETLGLGALFPTRISEDSVEGLFVVPISTDPAGPYLQVLRFRAEGRFGMPAGERPPR